MNIDELPRDPSIIGPDGNATTGMNPHDQQAQATIAPEEKKGFQLSPEDKQAKENLWLEQQFTADGRKSYEELYAAYDTLVAAGWEKQLVYTQTITTHDGREISLPVYAYIWQGKNPEFLWSLSGVHGEEPAGPNAMAESIKDINALKKKGISTVFIPLLNPVSYYRDWRYFDVPRDRKKGFFSSVTDSEHAILKNDGSGQPREPQPMNRCAAEVVPWIIEAMGKYRPKIVFDHHEDLLEPELQQMDANDTYSYVYGDRGPTRGAGPGQAPDEHGDAYGDSSALQKACQKITNILISSGSPIVKSGKTGFGEVIENGFVFNSPDGSVDQLLSEDYYYDNGKIEEKIGAKAVFVFETTRARETDTPEQLRRRMSAHQEIIKLYADLYAMV